MTPYEAITQLIGNVVLYAGGSAAVAYALFVFLGKHWIDARFARDIEKYKREQEAELEKLKLKINTLFNKVLKTQDREYDILPTLWSKLQKLRMEVSRAVSLFRELPDLDRYDEKSIERFIKEAELPEAVAENLRKDSNKNNIYTRYLDFKQMYEAQKAFGDFNEYYEINKIFLSPELKEKFSQIHTHLWSVWVDRKMSLDTRSSQTDFWGKAYKGMQEKGEPLLNEIEDLVQKHLYNHEL